VAAARVSDSQFHLGSSQHLCLVVHRFAAIDYLLRRVVELIIWNCHPYFLIIAD